MEEKIKDQTKTGLYITTREYNAKGTEYLVLTLVEYKDGKPTNTVGIKGLIKDNTRLKGLQDIIDILTVDSFPVPLNATRNLVDPKLETYAKSLLSNTDNFEKHMKDHIADLDKMAPSGDMNDKAVLREKIANYVLVTKFDTVI